MTPIQQLMLGVGAKADPVYMDDVFSTYLFKGNNGTQAINNGIDLSGEGGMVWTKNRDSAFNNYLYDTERGVQKFLISDSTIDEQDVSTSLTAFNSNGFTLGANDYGNITNGNKATSWTFRKAPGFFDVVAYDGDSGSPGWGTVDIAHNLGCIPGLIIIKRTTGTGGWWVYHRDLEATTNAAWSKVLRLDSNAAVQTSFNLGTASYHTATTFRVGNDNVSNNTGDSYVAYLFAGGESTAATARSVDFDGSGAYISLASGSSSSLRPGTGDFCIEAWLNPDSFSNERGHYMTDNGGILFQSDGTNYIFKKHGGSALLTGPGLEIGQWTHVAVTRSGTSLKMFYNGTQVASATDSTDITGTAVTYIGSTIAYWDGKISNLRLVIGSAVYTSSFKPPTEPLTNITNTVLLCCNDSSTTGSTVTPGTITATGSPTASTDSPFDDPAGLVFGDAEDQNVIKCGSYVGNGSATGPEINLGWEPQWVLIKNADAGQNWGMFDSMRGIATGGNDGLLYPSGNWSEDSLGFIDLTSTGFKVTHSDAMINGSGNKIIYIAIRRPDGYVGKPVELGTNVFAMDTGASSTTIPNFDNGFPVDFSLLRTTSSVDDWFAGARLIQGQYLNPNLADSGSSDSGQAYDFNDGFYVAGSSMTSYQSWMWKRHAGFDVVTYDGNGSVQNVTHSLSKIPEMIWIKGRNISSDWAVYHKGQNGGTNPEQYHLHLDSNTAEAQLTSMWNDTAPTATHFTVGSNSNNNSNNNQFIAMLFASVPGISKVGSYAGSSSSQTITLGFQPRFLIIKAIDSAQNWWVLDTTNGWGSGNENYLALNQNWANDTHDFGAPTSTGFTLTVAASYNTSGTSFLYYAHA
jgi:hypothetical protein